MYIDADLLGIQLNLTNKQMNNLIIRDAILSIGNELKLGSVFYYSIFLGDHDFSDTMYIILYYIILHSMYDNVYIRRIVTYLGCMDCK